MNGNGDETSLPPQDITAERCVLGSILYSFGKCLTEVRRHVGNESFFRSQHQVLYNAILDLFDESGGVDLVLLRNHLETNNLLDSLGGMPAVMDILESTPTAENAEAYAKIVAAKAAERRIWQAEHNYRRAAATNDPDVRRAALAELDRAEAAARNEPETVKGLVCLAGIDPKPVYWLWPYRIALGKLTIFAGNPGLGKSCLTLDLAARVSRGMGFADCPQASTPAGGVLLLSAEDALDDTIRPRLDAAGADTRRIHALTTAQIGTDQNGKPTFTPFSLTDHMPILEQSIRQISDCRLVIIDPISAFLGSTDSHNNAEVRAALSPLADLAARHRVAVVVVSHLNKGGGDALARVIGSIGFVAAARTVYAITKDQYNPAVRLFLPVKNCIGIDNTGFAFKLETAPNATVPRVAWDSQPISTSADEALTDMTTHAGRPPEDREEAQAWLVAFLQDGPRPAADCLADATRNGIAQATLRRAKSAAGIVAEKQGYQGTWVWKLDPTKTPFLIAPAKGVFDSPSPQPDQMADGDMF